MILHVDPLPGPRLCGRCGIRLPEDTASATIWCGDCRSLHADEGKAAAQARRELDALLDDWCECIVGNRTWRTCDICPRVNSYLVQQRIHIRRALLHQGTAA